MKRGIVFSLSQWERVGVRGLPVPVYPREEQLCWGVKG